MNKENHFKAARELLTSQHFGVLGTQSVDLPGYPFGSVTPYCLDHTGCPIILISEIALHTKNIQRDPKVSLTILDSSSETTSKMDPQAAARLTFIGDAKKLSDGEYGPVAAARYHRYFPSAEGYNQTHDFSFYRIGCVRGRYIGGFGKIFWVAGEDLVRPNPFSAEAENAILSHMNADHQEALRKYCEKYKPLANVGSLAMAGIDSEGFDLISATHGKLHFVFAQSVTTAAEARKALVEMAK